MECCFERARGGERAAVNMVVESLRPRMSRMALYYARCSGEDADDLLQEAWVGLLEALPRLDLAIGSPDQFLIQQARWRLLDSLKRAKVRRCDPLEESAMAAIPAAGGDEPTSIVYVRLFSRQLKETQQAVLWCLLAGLTWRETGKALGCTSANVAYHVRQIRRQYEAWEGK